MHRSIDTPSRPSSSGSFLRHHGLEPLVPHVADADVEQPPPLSQPTVYEPPFRDEPPLGFAEPLVLDPGDYERVAPGDEPMSAEEVARLDRRQRRARLLGVLGVLISALLAGVALLFAVTRQ